MSDEPTTTPEPQVGQQRRVMRRSKTIADHAYEVAREMGRNSVSWGDPDVLHEIAERSGIEARLKANGTRHPRRIHQRVLAALDRAVKRGDERFTKRYFLVFMGYTPTGGDREGMARSFVLRDA